MAQSTLGRKSIELSNGLDDIVIVRSLGDLPGGRTLDVSGLSADIKVICAGHVLVQDTTTKEVSPLAVSGGAYAALPAGCAYLGVLKASVSVDDPRAAILTMGQVNAAAAATAVGAPVTDEIKAALTGIQFLYV